MTLHSFLDMSTLEGRHLLASYGFVLLLQGGYFVWMLRAWATSKSPR